MNAKSKSRSLILFLIIAVVLGLTLYKTRPPAVVPASAPDTEFSAERAMNHIISISQKPHVTGSPELREVRDYIVGELKNLGLSPVTQIVVAQNPFREDKVALAENIIAKIPGSKPTQSILVIGHYDSPSTSPGAADDSSAVAAMLETARALEAGPPLANDVILLFSDAEESSLGGAYAALEHPMLADVGFVINLEMRGGSGPVIMFETGPENGWAVAEYAKAVPYPVGTSLTRELYKVMPNKTDFTAFRDEGFVGLNFSNLEDMTRYHTPLGIPENLDQRTLQHHGYNTLGVLRHFGNLDLTDIRQGNAVYFDIWGTTLIHYPGFLTIPLSLLAILLFVGLAVAGFRRGLLTFKGVGQGFVAFLGVLVAGPGIVTLLWFLIRATINPPIIEGETYNSLLYFLGFGFIVMAVTVSLYTLFRRKVSTLNLTFGVLVWWVILIIGITFVFPTANYVFLWPFVFALIAAAYLVFNNTSKPLSWVGVASLSVAAIPAFLIWVPATLGAASGLIALVSVTGVSLAFIALMLGLLVPQFEAMTWSDSGLGKWWVTILSLALGIVILSMAMFSVSTDAKHPRLFHLIYALDTDSGESIWASIDSSMYSTEWSDQFFTDQAKSGPLPQYFGADRPVFQIDKAPSLSFSAPDVTILEDTKEGDVHKIRLSIRSLNGGTFIKFYIEPPAEVVSVTINGRSLRVAENSPDRQGPWELRYWGPIYEGMEFALEVNSPQAFELRMVEVLVGLPEIAGQSTTPPDYLTTFTCFCNNDSEMTLIKSSLTFGR